jgi:hypothetical protein
MRLRIALLCAGLTFARFGWCRIKRAAMSLRQLLSAWSKPRRSRRQSRIKIAEVIATQEIAKSKPAPGGSGGRDLVSWSLFLAVPFVPFVTVYPVERGRRSKFGQRPLRKPGQTVWQLS